MKNLFLMIAAIIMMAFSAVIQADRPALYQWEETFTDWNPCTEQENEVTLYHNWYEHWHKNGAVFMDKYTGETDDGYFLYDGKYHLAGNFVTTQIAERIRDTWVSADGSSYRFHYMVVWVWDVGEARMEDIRYECLD